ncbi:MAG: threonylcarbamoyl-AMP synthase [Rhodopirellula sp. TMED11]|nr:MAG: threonylcarbamoyl-AMP synthase [Rhodopirellula sp. TMED11]
MTLIVQPDTSSIQAAAESLAAGQLVAVPTETVYGLAADATNPAAVAKIFAAKGRPANNPLIVHVASSKAIEAWAKIESNWLRNVCQAAEALWPGPLTIVLPKRETIPDAVTAGGPTVAVRVPHHPVMQQLLAACPFPLAAPSANRSNSISPTRAEHVAQSLSDHVAMILDGGSCQYGVESTVIRPTERGVEILRPGGISKEQLQQHFELAEATTLITEAVSDKVQDRHQGLPNSSLPSPGMLSKHYSPAKPIVFVDQWNADQVPARSVARISFSSLSADEASRFCWHRAASESGDLNQVAHQLFDFMRQADNSACQLIVVDRCVRTGMGAAIMDRLDRATR